MSNTDRVNGFRFIGHLNGAPVNGATHRYYVDPDYATALFPGDVVKLVASNESKGRPTVEACAAGTVHVGVIASVEFDPDNLGRRYLPASTGGWVKVYDAPDALFEVQASSDADVEDGDLGGNANHLAGAGNTTTGASGYEIDTGSATAIASTNTYTWTVLRLVEREDNALGAHAKLIVRANLHQYGQGADATGSTGATGVHA